MKTVLRRLLQITLAIAILISMDVTLIAQNEQSFSNDESKIKTSSANIAEATSKSRYSREGLESKGISFTATYRAESFGSLLGGIRSKFGANYFGSADMTIGLALDKLKLGRGHIVISGQSMNGRDISERTVGTVQAVSNMEEESFSKLIEAYYADSYLDNRVILKVGRQYADADFDVLDNAGDFLNSSYGLIPTIPMPTYPAPQFGGSVWISPKAWLSVGAGVFRADNLDPISETGTTMRKGVFAVSEVKVMPYSRNSAIHGTYHVGVWRQGSSTYRTNATEGERPLGNYGAYATADHWFRKQDSAGNNIGPGVFFQLGWSPEDRSPIHRYIGGGFAWPGCIPRRSRDSIGMGVTSAWINGAKRNDTVTELFYKLQVSPKVFIQPDLQYAYKPGGKGVNALLGGVRLGLAF